uniref:Uncharacterized protein n=1 Tax=Rhizophagus irregularis (strain DAOM 181602 / DAOM 197198 / MUCL 43194) TaxID=747089 RepID=U9T7U1_RHIID
MEQNFALIYRTSFENNSFLQLQKYCNYLISEEPSKIFNFPIFSSIPEKLLVSLIQNENVQLNEVQIGNIFHNLTSKEFSDKVMPYKKILPKDLYKELLKDFLNNNSSPIKNSLRSKNKDDKEIHMNINSKIISLPYIEIVTKWINRLKITDRLTNSYKYKLLFYGSCNDGFIINKLHDICNNQSHTITFIKIKDSDEIFGGYNPIKWKFDNSFGITKDSFIFSFKNNNFILSRVMDERKKNHVRIITAKNKFLTKLSQNLLEILDDNEYYDITIEVGNDPYVKVFRAHMVILNYRSSYFRRILSTNKKKNDETLINIKLSNIKPEIFQLILRYIYGGSLSLEEFDTSDIIKILITAILKMIILS